MPPSGLLLRVPYPLLVNEPFALVVPGVECYLFKGCPKDLLIQDILERFLGFVCGLDILESEVGVYQTIDEISIDPLGLRCPATTLAASFRAKIGYQGHKVVGQVWPYPDLSILCHQAVHQVVHPVRAPTILILWGPYTIFDAFIDVLQVCHVDEPRLFELF